MVEKQNGDATKYRTKKFRISNVDVTKRRMKNRRNLKMLNNTKYRMLQNGDITKGKSFQISAK